MEKNTRFSLAGCANIPLAFTGFFGLVMISGVFTWVSVMIFMESKIGLAVIIAGLFLLTFLGYDLLRKGKNKILFPLITPISVVMFHGFIALIFRHYEIFNLVLFVGIVGWVLFIKNIIIDKIYRKYVPRQDTKFVAGKINPAYFWDAFPLLLTFVGCFWSMQSGVLYHDEQLARYRVETKAYVVSTSYSESSGYGDIVYRFEANGEIIEGNESRKAHHYECNSGDSVNMIYSSEEPLIHTIAGF